MKLRLVVGLIVALIIGVPTLFVNLYAIGAWDFHSRLSGDSDERGADPGPPPVIGGIGRGFFDFVTDREERSEKLALFDIGTPNKDRYVVIDRHFKIEDVLAEGEEMPDPALHKLYILARAPALIMEECASVLEHMAEVCAVSRVDVGDKSSNDETYRTALWIGFLQTAPAGDLSAIDRQVVQTQELRIEEYKAGSYRMSDLPKIYSNAYRTAVASCDQLREQVGTCVIKSIDINEYRKFDAAKGQEAGFSADIRITLAFLAAPDSEENTLTAADDTVTDDEDRVGFTPPVYDPNPVTRLDTSESGGVFGALQGLVSGEEAPANEPPAVLNGGNAFGGRGAGKTIRVGGN